MQTNLRQLPTRSLDQNATGTMKVLDDNYLFDANGNVTDITDQAQAGLTTRGMSYDKLDRLTAAVSPAQWGNATYAYDPLDNIRSADQGPRQYRYNYNATSNRLTNIKTPGGATVFSFGMDARGNTTSKGAQGYTFDSANRLNVVNGLQTYRYDGQGRRVQTTDTADGKTTFWIYSQAGQVLHTSEARRSRNLSYIYLGNTQVATRAVAWTGGAVTVSYQHTDALGSPVAETNDVGTVIARHSYAPYGEAYAGSVDGTGYTGHVMDQGTGLIYMQQRYYDPGVGRFLSTDPAGSGFNEYNYAANNPYRFLDPDGRASESINANWNTHLCDMGCDSGSFSIGDGGSTSAKHGKLGKEDQTWQYYQDPKSPWLDKVSMACSPPDSDNCTLSGEISVSGDRVEDVVSDLNSFFFNQSFSADGRSLFLNIHYSAASLGASGDLNVGFMTPKEFAKHGKDTLGFMEFFSTHMGVTKAFFQDRGGPSHEMGHGFGLRHAPAKSGSIMDYDFDSTKLHIYDVYNLFNIFGGKNY